MPYNSSNLDVMAGEAESVFRIVRNLNPRDESDFNITKSDNIVSLLLKNIKFITLAATLIGIITLFGAAVGLMNIMLVSVAERTREIGTRKAVGAKTSTIKYQFLIGGKIKFIQGYGECSIFAAGFEICCSMDLGFYRCFSLFSGRCRVRLCACNKSGKY